MNRRKALGLGLMLCSKAFVVLPTGSSTTISSGRDASIAVADESNAYLEVETDEATATSDELTPVTVGKITNNLATDLTWVDVRMSGTLSEGSPVREIVPNKRSLGTGESAKLIATVDCGDETTDTETVTLAVEASGSDVELSTTRTVRITCDVPDVSESESVPSAPGQR